MELLIVWMICGAIAAAIAAHRNASAGMGFVAGLLLGPIGIAVAFLIAPDKTPDGKQ